MCQNCLIASVFDVMSIYKCGKKKSRKERHDVIEHRGAFYIFHRPESEPMELFQTRQDISIVFYLNKVKREKTVVQWFDTGIHCVRDLYDALYELKKRIRK